MLGSKAWCNWKCIVALNLINLYDHRYQSKVDLPKQTAVYGCFKKLGYPKPLVSQLKMTTNLNDSLRSSQLEKETPDHLIHVQFHPRDIHKIYLYIIYIYIYPNHSIPLYLIISHCISLYRIVFNCILHPHIVGYTPIRYPHKMVGPVPIKYPTNCIPSKDSGIPIE